MDKRIIIILLIITGITLFTSCAKEPKIELNNPYDPLSDNYQGEGNENENEGAQPQGGSTSEVKIVWELEVYDGFEDGNWNSNPAWEDTSTGSTPPVVTTATVYAGNYALKCYASGWNVTGRDSAIVLRNLNPSNRNNWKFEVRFYDSNPEGNSGAAAPAIYNNWIIDNTPVYPGAGFEFNAGQISPNNTKYRIWYCDSNNTLLINEFPISRSSGWHKGVIVCSNMKLIFYIDDIKVKEYQLTEEIIPHAILLDVGCPTLTVYYDEVKFYTGRVVTNTEVTGPSGFISYFGGYGTEPGKMNRPHGIDCDNEGNIYVADLNNHRIQKFDKDGNFITSWGTYGSGNGQFIYPHGVAVDKNSNVIYVVDHGNKRIQKFTLSGDFITSWNIYNDYTPYYIAIDSSGNIYVSCGDNNCIQKYSSSGSYLLTIGGEGSGSGYFNGPTGLDFDSNDILYVCDTDNDLIQKFNTDGTFISQWSCGKQPYKIEIYGNYAYITTHDPSVRKYTLDGTYIKTYGRVGSDLGEYLIVPRGILVNPVNNYLYFCDTDNSNLSGENHSRIYIYQL